MAQEFQTEVEDAVNSEPEHANTVVATSGVPEVIQRLDNKEITLTYVKNPSKGTRINDKSDVIYISIDGSVPTSNGTTLVRGEYIYIPGQIVDGNLKIDSNNSGTNVEIILWG